MNVNDTSQEKLLKQPQAVAFKKDMEIVTRGRHNPFVKNGRVDVDAYIEFVTQYNDFINHKPKPFRRMIDNDMKL